MTLSPDQLAQARIGGPLDQLQWLDLPFNVAPDRITGLIPAGATIIDSVRGALPQGHEKFVPRIWSVGAFKAPGTDETPTEPAPKLLTSAAPNEQGDIPIELRGLYRAGGGGIWVRRFLVPPFRRFEVDISSFPDISASVLGTSGAQGFAVYSTVSNRPPPQDNQRDLPFWAETYDAPGTYDVPPGADRALADVADAGFAWRVGTVAGGFGFAFGAPLAVGVPVDVMGGRFTTTVAGLRITWRIRL